MASPVTITATTMIASAVRRVRLDRRRAGEDVRPGLADDRGATCRAGRAGRPAARPGTGVGAGVGPGDGAGTGAGVGAGAGEPRGGAASRGRGGRAAREPGGRPGSPGLGTKGRRGLGWPPRSLAGGDTIRLPVTFAVSAPGPFPWPHPAWPGPDAC